MEQAQCEAAQYLIGCSPESITWWQMGIRALIVFAFGLVAIRLFGRRAFGKQSALDIVLAIVIGSNLSRAITANAALVPTLCATMLLVALYWLMNRLAARFHAFGVLMKGKPAFLVRGGRPDAAEMRRHGVSHGDLEEAARLSGHAAVDELEEAVLERSGEISTVGRPVRR